jgi:hypothetical protein
MDTPITYRIPAANLPYVEEKLAGINKTAAKLGCDPVRFVQVGTETEKGKNAAGVEFTIEYLLLTLEGTTPKFAGWHLVAVIEMLGDERLVKNVPGLSCPVSYRSGGMTCDHCQCDRRRSQVLVLQHEDGTFKQVGKSCVKDFLGGTSPESILSWAEMLADLTDLVREASEGYLGGGCRPTPNINEYLATVCVCIRRLGWVSAKMAADSFVERMTTGYLAWRICTDSNNKYIAEMIRDSELKAEERDIELATKALEWATALASDGGDYFYNLGVAARSGIVDNRTIGLIASSISAYLREQDRIEELNIKAREPFLDEHIGEIKERRGFVVTIKRLKSFESNFGVKTLVRMKDAEGRVIIWWASGEAEWVKEGETYEITGTIKEHGEYNGRKQTVLQRVAQGLPKPKKGKKAA